MEMTMNASAYQTGKGHTVMKMLMNANFILVKITEFALMLKGIILVAVLVTGPVVIAKYELTLVQVTHAYIMLHALILFQDINAFVRKVGLDWSARRILMNALSIRAQTMVVV